MYQDDPSADPYIINSLISLFTFSLIYRKILMNVISLIPDMKRSSPFERLMSIYAKEQ